MNRKERRENNRRTNKVLCRLKNIVESVHNENGYTKMFICIDNKNIKNVIVLNYDGNERLEESLGSDTIIKLGEKEYRDQLVIMASVLLDGYIVINDGQCVYEVSTHTKK